MTGLPPTIIARYIAARLVLPVLLIVYAAHSATPAQRLALVRDHLLYQPHQPGPPHQHRGTQDDQAPHEAGRPLIRRGAPIGAGQASGAGTTVLPCGEWIFPSR